MRILRVFPRKTTMSPTDALAYFRAPTLIDLADIEHLDGGVDEVHVSVTFTYDKALAEDLYKAWQVLGVPVKMGGPAFDDRMGDFTPGLYLKEGCTFTSRGCTRNCWFCSVPKCAHGVVRELPIQAGHIIMDDNILATSMPHFESVIEMLKQQKDKAVFSGGLEPSMLTDRHAELLYSIKPARMWTAYDTKDDLEPLHEMRKKLLNAGFSYKCRKIGCYVLIGYKGDTFDAAEARLNEAIAAGYMPFAMLYRDERGEVNHDWKTFQREWCRMVYVGKKYSIYWNGRTDQ